jgi:hypothetical protein
MPRHVIARITVDRPWLYQGERAERSAEWLEAKAEEIESEPNCYSLSGWTARRIAGVWGDETVTKLRIGAAGCLSLETRKRIATWLRSRAKYLRKHWAVAQTSRRGWFVQEFSL